MASRVLACTTKLITQNWDDLLRVAGSLHQGTVSASELMRSLLRSKRPSTLARAIAALGRIPKTLYMLAYVDDEQLSSAYPHPAQPRRKPP